MDYSSDMNAPDLVEEKIRTQNPPPTDDQDAYNRDETDKNVHDIPPTYAVEQADIETTNSVLSGLLNVATLLVGVSDLDELLGNLLPRLIYVLPDIHGGLLWVYERRTRKLRLASTCGLPLTPPLLTTLAGVQLDTNEGVAGQALQSRETILITTKSGYRDIIERVMPSNQVLVQHLHDHLPRILVSIGVPLQAGDETIGVVELMSFGAEEEQLKTSTHLLQPLQAFGSLVAATVKNKQLYEQAQRHYRNLDAFDAVVTAISTATDLDDLMGSVLDVILELMPVSAGIILLLDPAQARLTLGSYRGLVHNDVKTLSNLPVNGSACEEVVRYGQPTLRLLLEERGEAALLARGLEGCAYLPLLAGGTVVGVLALYGVAELHKQLDVHRLMPLGNQVGFAIANVRLYEDSQLERRKLNTVINSITEGVVLCDSKGQLILANEAAMELLSLDAIPFHQPLSEMPDFYGIRDLDGQPLPVERLPMALALSGEVFHDYRVLIRGASGSNSVMSFSGAPAQSDNDGIEGAVVVFRDITAHQRLERAKDEFLAIAAHELRSPLAAVRSYAEMLLRRERQRSEGESQDLRGLTILSQQVTHMLRMVDNLLDLSRLDAGRLDLQLQRINLVSLAGQVIDQHQPMAKTTELVLDAEQPEIWVQCDSMRIRQVLSNLLSNAIKYSPPDTKVTVRLARCEAEKTNEPREKELGSEKECQPPEGPFQLKAPFVRISVADRGRGISPEQQSQLFRRFYRVKSKGRRVEGLGLGLYLSRQFVLMHRGTIWVESKEGEGSTFCFALPGDDEIAQMVNQPNQ